MCSPNHTLNGDHGELRIAAVLNLTEFKQVLHSAGQTPRFDKQTIGQRVDHFGVMLADQRLGKQRHRSYRSAELVADIGYEIAPNSVALLHLGDIVNERNRSHEFTSAQDRYCRDEQHPPWRPIQSDALFNPLASYRGVDQLINLLRNDRFAVPALAVPASRGVAENDILALINNDNTHVNRFKGSLIATFRAPQLSLGVAGLKNHLKTLDRGNR